jgi:TRAP-type C4-dicarboxylate transport system substrate-binding protein
MSPAMSRNRRFACKCLLAGAASALIGLASAAGAREFRAADIQEENYPTVQALRYMDQLVAERTNGRHRIRVFHSRQLGEESQTIEQTRVGAIDMNRINVGAIGNYAPALNVLALPFLFSSIEHLYRVVDGPVGEQILASIEPGRSIPRPGRCAVSTISRACGCACSSLI